MRLRTIGLISTLALGLLAGPLPTEAQKATKIPRVGYLSSGRKSPSLKPFRQGLRELGYVDGQNIVIVARSARDKGEAELVRLKVDVIVTSPGPRAIRAAQQATRTIPIVMSGVRVDPVKAGFVVSLARPGGNITGLADLRAELHGKRLEIFKEALPRISRVTMLWNQGQLERWGKKIKAQAQALGIELQSVAVHRRDIDRTFSEISRETQGLSVTAAGGASVRNRARIVDFAMKRRLPAIYDRSQFVVAGGLMSYGTDLLDLYRQAATFVGKILNGAKPADLPVERPKKFELSINLKTAKQLGITIPPSVLYRANKVIK